MGLVVKCVCPPSVCAASLWVFQLLGTAQWQGKAACTVKVSGLDLDGRMDNYSTDLLGVVLLFFFLRKKMHISTLFPLSPKFIPTVWYSREVILRGSNAFMLRCLLQGLLENFCCLSLFVPIELEACLRNRLNLMKHISHCLLSGCVYCNNRNDLMIYSPTA